VAATLTALRKAIARVTRLGQWQQAAPPAVDALNLIADLIEDNPGGGGGTPDDESVTLAKIADGTAGELITWDASGEATTVATGTATHVLTSNGAGAAPTFQAAPSGAVSSVFARTGAVVAVAGDYDSDEVTNASAVSGATVSDALDALNVPQRRTIGVTFDGGGSTPTAGSVGLIVAQMNGTIDRWDIVADASGSAVVDVWKRAGAIPTDAHRIAGTERPTLSAAQLSSDTSLTTWSTLAVSIGDVFGFELESVSTCTRVTVSVRILETA